MLAAPSIQGVRLATLDDLPRIAMVAAAAFFWSPTFQFQRPRYHDFPSDTVASYLAEYEAAINDPACAVLVAEDVLARNEADFVYEALRSTYTSHHHPHQFQGIVGVCSVSLKPGSSYLGHFQPQARRGHVGVAGSNTSPATLTAEHLHLCNMKRDQCAAACEVYCARTGPAKLKHLAGKMRLSTLAVAPFYWRRGHASRLVRFCTLLADQDDAVMGVSATPSGAIVVGKVGFQECETVHIKHLPAHELRERKNPSSAADVTLWIGIRLPCSTSSSSANVSRPESPTSSQSTLSSV